MRVAVISDVHANFRALEAVLEQIDSEHVDAVWCLGDTVGYGPLPNECCSAVESRSDVSLVGNHDLVVLGKLPFSDFNDEAAAAARWTSEVLSRPARAFLDALEPAGTADGVDLFHASARDPVWEYVLTEEAAAATLELSHAPLVLVGHSHVALAITVDDRGLRGGPAPAGTEIELDGRWLLNPGSVGQPRDGDPRAAWLLLDTAKRFAAFRRVQYPIHETQAEMRARGLPEPLAARLGHGE
jgi:diadenosine tetraphosphatase ApaH/serine/threonine PP2A family protein phosphatase